MSEKTEQPTSRKLRKLREKGQIWTSRELMTSVVFILSCGAFSFSAPYMIDAWDASFREVMRIAAKPNIPSEYGHLIEFVSFKLGVWVLGLLALTSLGAILTGLVQTNGLISFEPIAPKFEKLNPATNAKSLFSIKSLFGLLSSALKLTVLLYALKYALGMVLSSSGSFEAPHLHYLLDPLFSALILIVGVYCLVSILWSGSDVLFQRFNYLRQQRMSKQEVRDDYKEAEGNPHIKGKRRSLHREISRSDRVEAVRSSKVVVVNPTHIAIAIQFDPDEIPVPVIGAKGEGDAAKSIIAIAKSESIPVIQNIPLARKLYALCAPGMPIDEALYEPVAELLARIWKPSSEKSNVGPV